MTATRVSPLAIPTNGEGQRSRYHLNLERPVAYSDRDLYLDEHRRPEPRGRRYAGYDEEEADNEATA